MVTTIVNSYLHGDVLLVLQALPAKPLTAAGLASFAGIWSQAVTLTMLMFCLASKPFPAEPLSCCRLILWDRALSK
jgi:hypothetical protein